MCIIEGCHASSILQYMRVTRISISDHYFVNMWKTRSQIWCVLTIRTGKFFKLFLRYGEDTWMYVVVYDSIISFHHFDLHVRNFVIFCNVKILPLNTTFHLSDSPIWSHGVPTAAETQFSLQWYHISIMTSQINDNLTVCSIASSG